LGTDLTASIPFPTPGLYGQGKNFGPWDPQTETPLWAGESLQYPGLDQINVAFPTCINSVVATPEKRYDAFMAFSDIYGIERRLYIPFVVRAGDKDCFAPPPPPAKTATTLTITSKANPSTYGQTAFFTAAITPTLATGTVTLTDGSTVFDSQILSNGNAVFSTSALSGGSHTIKATYTGNNSYQSSSATIVPNVNPIPTTTSLASSQNPSKFGQAVTFTASVTDPGYFYVTGTVTFFGGSTKLGSVSIGNNFLEKIAVATFTTSNLAQGSHSITATYGGTTSYNGSTSHVLTQVVQ
jgi:hypothetical protein